MKQIDHDPNEPEHPSRAPTYSVMGIVAVVIGLQLQRNGWPDISWAEWIAMIALGLFCLWNYGPKRQR